MSEKLENLSQNQEIKYKAKKNSVRYEGQRLKSQLGNYYREEWIKIEVCPSNWQVNLNYIF